MIFEVFRVITKQFKIINGIIRYITIYMMDYFVWSEKSSQLFFHDQYVFKNIFLVVTNNSGMIRAINIYVASTIFIFIRSKFFSSLSGAFQIPSSHFSSNMGVVTFSGAVKSSFSSSIKLFRTVFAFSSKKFWTNTFTGRWLSFYKSTIFISFDNHNLLYHYCKNW